MGTSYAYDTGGRLISTTYSDDTPDVFVTYDALGRQVTQSNGTATTTYAYNTATLALSTETITYNLPGADPFTRVLDRSRDNLGRDTGWKVGTIAQYNAGWVDGNNDPDRENAMNYAYGVTDGRLQTVAGASSSSFQYSYLPNSNLLSTITGPTHTVTNAWQADRNVLVSKENKVDTTVISSYSYDVNHLGQRTGVNKAGTAFSSTRTIDWGYNSKGEVVKADHSADSAFNRTYQYDGIGNRLQSSAGVPPAAITTYTPNALNQYSSITNPQSTILNPSYDFDGNMTSGPLPIDPASASTLTWDAENRLISTTVNAVTTTYLYDAQSRRIAQTTGTASTIYVYDGWNPIAEYSATALSKTYTWGMDLSGSMQGAGGVGGLLAVTDSTGTYYPTFDGNGNISEYLDSTGAISAHYEYDPFGRETVSNGTKAGDFAHRFSTKPLDPTTGLYYYGYRYYDPTTGRWPSRDPIEERGGINLYSVRNDFLNSLDFVGLSLIKIYVNRFSDDQIAGLGFRANSATIGVMVMTVEKDDRDCDCAYPDNLLGLTLEQPRGRRNLFGIANRVKTYPIPKGSYDTEYDAKAPGGTEGFYVDTPNVGFGDIHIHTGSSATSSEGCIIVGNRHVKGNYFDTFFVADPNAEETKRNVEKGIWVPWPSDKVPNRYKRVSGPNATGIEGSAVKLQAMVDFYKKVLEADKTCNAKTKIKTIITDEAPRPPGHER